MSGIRTHIATADATSITVRGRSLTGELMGKKSFSEMVYFLTCGRMPEPAQAKVLDCCLVALMEHGWVPASIVTRMAIDSVPDDVQLAMAAGLLTVGPVFAGTMEGCARLLEEGLAHKGDRASWCDEVVQRHRAAKQALPGFGHRSHKPDDPRTPVILQVAREAGCSGPHAELLAEMGAAVDEAFGKHITINATGAMAAVLLDIGMPAEALRGIAVISRAGGLLGHVMEERRTHSARALWELAREHIPYQDPGDDD